MEMVEIPAAKRCNHLGFKQQQWAKDQEKFGFGTDCTVFYHQTCRKITAFDLSTSTTKLLSPP
jgi:hypothetical protein